MRGSCKKEGRSELRRHTDEAPLLATTKAAERDMHNKAVVSVDAGNLMLIAIE